MHTIVVHGGAGTISKSSSSKKRLKQYETALDQVVELGYSILEKGGSAIRATKIAAAFLEDCSLFNAGKGSVYTYDGMHEMDAAIMDGKSKSAGSVAAVRSVKNPIFLADLIRTSSKHVLLSGVDAKRFAEKHDLEIMPDEYFEDPLRYKQWKRAQEKNKVIMDHSDGELEEPDKYGTIGVVALDKRGNLAAATSTGGMTNKRWGRIGDSPIIGAGTYANNNTCAVSCTGHGEYFIRSVMAFRVSALMEYSGLSLKDAAKTAMHDLGDLGGRGGFIGLDNKGNIVMPFNTKGMYRGFKNSNEKQVGIF